jgi:hypothetical protein
MQLPYNHGHYADAACLWCRAWLENYSYYKEAFLTECAVLILIIHNWISIHAVPDLFRELHIGKQYLKQYNNRHYVGVGALTNDTIQE